MNILILCTGNSCRSQMAEGFLKSFDATLNVYSAGTKPAFEVHPIAIKVMKELNIDLSENKPEAVSKFLNDKFDFVITVCSDAKESCPMFTGNVKHRIHIGFDDPADTLGNMDEIIKEFRSIRDEIKKDFFEFYKENIT